MSLPHVEGSISAPVVVASIAVAYRFSASRGASVAVEPQYRSASFVPARLGAASNAIGV